MTRYEARGAGVYESRSPTAYPIAITPFNREDRAMARRIADALNGHGRLREALEGIAADQCEVCLHPDIARAALDETK